MVLTVGDLQKVFYPNEEYQGVAVEVKDPWPRPASSKPFKFADIKKALSLTVVNESPTMTGLMASSMVLGTVVSGGNPVAGMLVSKAVPLGYVGFKAAQLALMDNKTFWENMREVEDTIKYSSGFWQGVGKAYALGTADKYDTFGDASLSENIGSIAGLLMRDFTAAAGLSKVISSATGIKNAASRSINAAVESGLQPNIKAAMGAAAATEKLINGIALSSSMSVTNAVERYNIEIGAGTNESDAMAAAISSGTASGASGLIFLGIAPFAIAKYANRINESLAPRMFVSSAEWAGWAGVQEQTNNLIRTKVYDLDPDEESEMNDLAKLAGFGAAFTVGGAFLGALASRAGNGVNRYLTKRAARSKTAADFNEIAKNVEVVKQAEETGIPSPTAKISEEVAQVNGFNAIEDSISKDFAEFKKARQATLESEESARFQSFKAEQKKLESEEAEKFASHMGIYREGRAMKELWNTIQSERSGIDLINAAIAEHNYNKAQLHLAQTPEYFRKNATFASDSMYALLEKSATTPVGKKSFDGVSIISDESGHRLDKSQLKWAVDMIRLRISEGVKYEEAIAETWNKIPKALRTTNSKKKLLRALEIGD